MVVKQSIHTLFIVTLPIILTDHFNLKCDPVHELSKDDAVLSLEITNFTKPFVTISKQNTDLLSCDKGGCFPMNCFNPFIINFNNKTWFENNTLIITISINGSWREQKKNNSAIGNWEFSFPDWDTQTCKLETYAIYDGPNCSNTCLQDYSNITCFLTKVYPEALCHFNLSHEIGKLTNIAYQNVDYVYDYKLYYNTSCTITLPNNVTQNITVTMYPNVTGKSDDKKYGKSATIKIVVILTNIICFSVVIAIGITVSILHFRKTRGYDVENKYLVSIGLNNADPYLHIVTEIDNLDIYSVIDLVNPKCTSEIIDPYSKVKESNTQSRKVSGYKEIHVKNLKQNLDNDFYVNFHNATGVKDSNGKDTNMQKKALTMPRETMHPIQLKRVVINDTQYTLVHTDSISPYMSKLLY
ncbi:polymorphic transmembrane cluster 2 transmembrane protein 11 [Biomphalaria pfeifferi]|uniref:Polymorphic transmembrane cluster 2 transmembrane protein 11 n=1 Tax=Biomphalaria pfeifferi TaxID=112525 RepID=A0AAD8FK44_BIOPF|nr:polymorphic transmembrane cluster 2 transmembrane protein 11 [Biomphalaria pfeifferi]